MISAPAVLRCNLLGGGREPGLINTAINTANTSIVLMPKAASAAPAGGIGKLPSIRSHAQLSIEPPINMKSAMTMATILNVRITTHPWRQLCASLAVVHKLSILCAAIEAINIRPRRKRSPGFAGAKSRLADWNGLA
jgi:hypothetical protein